MFIRQASAPLALTLVLATAGLAGLGAGGQARAETQLERGEYLVRVVAACGNCHTPLGPDGPIPGQELAGRLNEKTPAFTAYAPNITQDVETGIGGWSDAEIKRAIREGLRPDDTLIGPPMPFVFHRSLGDEDLDAIVAFLRTLPPVRNEVPASVYNIPLPPAWGPPVASVTAPERGVSVEYGACLAGPVAHCMERHTRFGPAGPMIEDHLGSGGNAFHGPWGVSVSANLTPHEDGIAALEDAELIAMIRTGMRHGKPMLPPMGYGYYAGLSDEDAQAIVLYLRSLPPLPMPH